MTDIAIRIENLSKLYPSMGHFDFTQDKLRPSPSTGSGQASGAPSALLRGLPVVATGRVNSKFAIRNPKFVLTGRENIYLNGAILGQ